MDTEKISTTPPPQEFKMVSADKCRTIPKPSQCLQSHHKVTDPEITLEKTTFGQ